MLFHAVQAYKAVYPKMPGVNILKPGLIYPIDWRRTVWGPNDGPGMCCQVPKLPLISHYATLSAGHFGPFHACGILVTSHAARSNGFFGNGLCGATRSRMLIWAL